jgi:hypothetical protein
MPLGLFNAPATYQRAMNHALAGLLWKFLAVYIDDVFVYSRTPEEHRQHLAEAIARLRDSGILLNPKMCRFGLDRVEYLGHIVSAEGVSPDPRKVERIRDFPAPETRKQLQVFLGLSGYYRRFIRRYGEMAAPRHAAAAGGGPLEWTPTCQAASRLIAVSIRGVSGCLIFLTLKYVTNRVGVGVGVIVCSLLLWTNWLRSCCFKQMAPVRVAPGLRWPDPQDIAKT